MGNEIYTGIKEKLKAKPKKLTDLDQWLFVVVNTAKSIIFAFCGFVGSRGKNIAVL